MVSEENKGGQQKNAPKSRAGKKASGIDPGDRLNGKSVKDNKSELSKHARLYGYRM